MRFFSFCLIITLFSTCSTKHVDLKPGIWRGVIALQGQHLPFNFDVTKDSSLYKINLINATEKIELREISYVGDSINIVLHLFDAELRARVYENSMEGFYYKNYDKSFKLPFHASFGDNFRFEKSSDQSVQDFSGKYQVQFISDVNDTVVSVGIFRQKGNYVDGTFLTPIGDYRYLEGNVVNDKLQLSTFDGNHAFLFIATKNNDSTLTGDFWSGIKYHESWTAIKNENAVMPDAESLTYLKEGYDKIDFSFPDVNNNMISPSHEKFKGKVLILQIFGTWCPNCIDETKFLAQWYTENKDRGVEILGLAYERKADFDYASKRVKKMKDRLNVEYDFVIAGTDDKKKASETLPMLNKVLAFPTTIFVGKDGKIKLIRTGFEGPGTGIYYDQFKDRFNQVVNELLAEDLALK